MSNFTTSARDMSGRKQVAAASAKTNLHKAGAHKTGLRMA
jgi:hypothetical protein